MTLLPRAITVNEAALLRSENQFSQVFATFHMPTTLYSARLAAVPTSTDGVLSITYNSGSGDQTKILNDMTMYVGTGAGAYDLGMVRIRDITGIGATSGTFNIDEQSAVSWQSNCYLTVVDEFTIWRRNIRLQGTTPFIDEIAYTDQNSKADSVPCFGPHRVFWYTGSNISTAWDASDSWAINNSITSYSWSAPGSVSSSGMATSTPTIVFNAAGTYRVSCTVGNSDGKSFTGYRYVFIVSEGNGATSAMTLNSMEGSLTDGGWRANITLFDEALTSQIRDRALCIIHTVDYYGDAKQSLGFAGGAENVLLVGWVSLENVEQPSQGFEGSVTFDVYTAHYLLDKITAFPAGLKDRTSTPTKWTRWQGLTSKAATWHQWHWRSTLTRCTDVRPLNNTVRASRIEAPGAQTLWEQMKTMQFNYIRAQPCCNRLSQVFNQVEQQALTTAERASIPTVGSITDDDWEGSIAFNRVKMTPVSLTDLSGVAWDGTTATACAAYSPGKVFRNFGKPNVIDRLVLADVPTTITLCGLFDGWKNNPYPLFPISFPGHNRFIDIAPYSYWNFSIDSSRNPRGVSFSGRVIPRTVKFEHTDSGCISTQSDMEAETFASLAVEHVEPTITIPDVVPPPPPPPPPIVPPISVSNAHQVWFMTSDGNIFWSGDYFNGLNGTSQPTWNKIVSGIGSPDQFFISNSGAVAYVHSLVSPTAWYKGTNLTTSPSWTNISVDPTNDDHCGPADCVGESLYAILNVPPFGNRNWKYSVYNGGWTQSSQFSTNWFSNTACTINMFSFADGFHDIFYTPPHAAVSGENITSRLAGGSIWKNSAGKSFSWTLLSGVSYVRDIGNGNVVTYGSGLGNLNGASVRGAVSGVEIQAVDVAGDLWLSNDGSTFTNVATWVHGRVYDSLSAGGGELVWVLDTIPSSNVPTRLYNRDGSVLQDMTGNLWSLTSGTLTVIGSGLVFT